MLLASFRVASAASAGLPSNALPTYLKDEVTKLTADFPEGPTIILLTCAHLSEWPS
jgi:hypothetical protein